MKHQYFCVWTVSSGRPRSNTDTFSQLLCSPFPSPFSRKYVYRRFTAEWRERGHSVQWEQVEQKHRWVTRWSASIFLLMSRGRGHVPHFEGGWYLLAWSRRKRSYNFQASLYLNWVEGWEWLCLQLHYFKEEINPAVILEICWKRVCLPLNERGRRGMPKPKELSLSEFIYYLYICSGKKCHFFVSFYSAGWTLAGCLFSVVLPNHFEGWHEHWSCCRALLLCSVSKY